MRLGRISILFFALLLFTAVTLFAGEIHEAAREGNVETVKAILQAEPGAATAATEDGETPLHLAASGNNLEIINLLIEHGADVDAKNSANQTPLLYAAYFGHRETVQLFLTRRAEFDYQDTRGFTPMHFAARQGGTAVVKLLAVSDARIDLRNNRGRTPLHLAAGGGHMEIVSFLAEKGAAVNTRDNNGESPVFTALSTGHHPVVDWLMHNGAEIDVGEGEAGRMLHLAASSGSTELVDMLISRGVGLDSVNEKGGTLLHSTAEGGLTEFVRRLIDNKADVGALDNTGKTALHYAVGGGHSEIIKLLLEHDADVAVSGKDGRTSLHIAIDWGRNDIIELLKAEGAEEGLREPYKIATGEGSSKGTRETVDAPQLRISYIANEGFLIRCGSEKVLIDALQRNPWNYVSTGEEIFQMMLDARPPFDGIDLVVASHAHLDHFEPEMVSRYMLENEDAIFVSSGQSVADLKEISWENYGEFESRVKNVNPDWGSKVAMTLNGVGVELFAVDHAGPGRPKVLTLATVLDLDGIRLAHLADLVAESSEEYFKAAALQEKGIDIAFIDPFFLQDSIGQVIIEEYIQPRHIILMHVRAAEIENYEKELRELYPTLIIFREPMETKLFIKWIL